MWVLAWLKFKERELLCCGNLAVLPQEDESEGIESPQNSLNELGGEPVYDYRVDDFNVDVSVATAYCDDSLIASDEYYQYKMGEPESE